VKHKTSLRPLPDISTAILIVRGERVILDADLAITYGVTTKRLLACPPMIAKGTTTSCRENLRWTGGDLESRHESRHDVAIPFLRVVQSGMPAKRLVWADIPAQPTLAL
jgi:hypothetical protein